MTFALPFRLTPDQDQKDIINGAQQNFEAITIPLNTNSFKIAKVGNINCPSLSLPDPGAGNYTVNQNSSIVTFTDLGYIPACVAFIQISGIYLLMPYSSFSGSGTGGRWWSIQLQVMSNSVACLLAGMTSGTTLTINAGDYNIKYYLLQETASV